MNDSEVTMNFQLFVEETKITDRFAPFVLDQDEPYVLVDVEKVDAAWKKGDQQHISPGGKGGVSGRYERFGEFWDDGNVVIAPLLNVRKNGTVEFNNGRHRFAYLRDHGFKQIPVSMDEEDLQRARKFGFVIKVLPAKEGIREFQGQAKDKAKEKDQGKASGKS